MPVIADRPEAPSAIRSDLGAIFVSLELSRSTWLITSLSPGGGEKMSKHSVPAGDICALLARFSELKQKALARTGKFFEIIVIQEAGLDGFWIHRALQKEGIESHVVVDPASIATSRRRRRAKTDRIDGEALLRALLAYKRGEPRVCAIVKAPTPQEEDRRRLCRERMVLTTERVQHVNRIKGLLFSQGVFGYEPLRRDRRQRLDELRTGDSRPLLPHLKTQISRELDRLELLIEQIKAVETERDALLDPAVKTEGAPAPQAMLLAIKGIGPQFAAVLWSEGLFRRFDNRHQLASYAGLAPTPWQSGSVDREQGVSKAGNPRLRPPSSSSPGYGCVINRNRRRLCGLTNASGATAVVSRNDHRSARAQAAGGAMEICNRRRRHRRSHDEDRLTRNAHRILKSSRTRSVLADPGGRTDGWPGLKSRLQERSILLSPARRKRDIGAAVANGDRM